MKVVHPAHQAILRGRSPLVCAVLWRMLDAPAAPPDGKQTSGGSVLEVLFLATSPEYRELGQAQELVKELEEAAQTMGCFAICVAAVPKQGISFWTRCGYEVAVPLEETATEGSEPSGPPRLGEPRSELGAFLLQKMLLFSDTPLVAKVLGRDQATWETGAPGGV